MPEQTTPDEELFQLLLNRFRNFRGFRYRGKKCCLCFYHPNILVVSLTYIPFIMSHLLEYALIFATTTSISIYAGKKE